MSACRERLLGKAILGDELLAEALEAFNARDHREGVPRSARFLLKRVLLAWGWLAMAPEGGYVAGAHLLDYRRSLLPDARELAPVVPLVRPARATAAL